MILLPFFSKTKKENKQEEKDSMCLCGILYRSNPNQYLILGCKRSKSKAVYFIGDFLIAFFFVIKKEAQRTFNIEKIVMIKAIKSVKT